MEDGWKIVEVVMMDGELFRACTGAVQGIEWSDTNDIVVHFKPIARTHGDSDVVHYHRRHLVVPIHNVRMVEEVESAGRLE